MLGDIEHLGDRPSENRGMTPRVFEYLFSRIKLVRCLVAMWDCCFVRYCVGVAEGMKSLGVGHYMQFGRN